MMPRLSKKQQEELARQQREERIREALHWTEEADGPDVPPPTGWRELVTGYMFNAHYLRVDVACTGPVTHAIERTDRTTTQGARSLYSTRERALRALRNVVERECAERLEKIDRMIEEQTP
jgi:hypothetical protein